jgi:hypothetical protein
MNLLLISLILICEKDTSLLSYRGGLQNTVPYMKTERLGTWNMKCQVCHILRGLRVRLAFLTMSPLCQFLLADLYLLYLLSILLQATEPEGPRRRLNSKTLNMNGSVMKGSVPLRDIFMMLLLLQAKPRMNEKQNSDITRNTERESSWRVKSDENKRTENELTISGRPSKVAFRLFLLLVFLMFHPMKLLNALPQQDHHPRDPARRGRLALLFQRFN